MELFFSLSALLDVNWVLVFLQVEQISLLVLELVCQALI